MFDVFFISILFMEKYSKNSYLLKPLINYFEENWIRRLVGRRPMTCWIPTFKYKITLKNGREGSVNLLLDTTNAVYFFYA